MPFVCAVINCRNKVKTPGISFHSFPSNPELNKIWLGKCGRELNQPTKSLRVCSSHFLPTDYKRLKTGFEGIKKLLKPGVIPSLNVSETVSSELVNDEPMSSSKSEAIMSYLQGIPGTAEQEENLGSPSNSNCENIDPSKIGEIRSPPLPMFLRSENNSIVEKFGHTKSKLGLDPTQTSLTTNTNDSELQDDLMEGVRESFLLKEQNDNLQNKIIQLNQRFEQLANHSEKQKLELTELRQKLNDMEQKAETKSTLDFLSGFLSANQISLLKKERTKVCWTSDEIATAFTIRYLSQRCYLYLRNSLHYPLPGLASLKRWAARIDMRGGILTDVLRLMAIAGRDRTDRSKVTVLQYDEMKVTGIYEYDRSADEVVGPYSQMQVVMARGLFEKWKQPVFIGFDQKMTPEILNNLISQLHQMTYNVVACTSDCGGANIGLHKHLGLSLEKTWFEHPETGRRIYMFTDAPHILKLVRNWLLDTGFILHDGTIIVKDPLVSLITKTDSEVNVTYKISDKHVDCKGPKRQNVRMAAELLSHTTATALKHYMQNRDDALACAGFIEAINSWFDIMNSYVASASVHQKSGYGMHLEEQQEILENVLQIVLHMRCTGKNSLQLFQKGLAMSIISLKQLYNDMVDLYGIAYILTHKLNQDTLENFFSQVRTRGGLNDHPTPLNALHRIRMIIMGKNPGIIQANTNTIIPNDAQEPYIGSIDAGEQFSSLSAQVVSKAAIKLSAEKDVIPELEYNHRTSSDTISSATSSITTDNAHGETGGDALSYIAGWIANKYKKDYPHLGDYTYLTLDHHNYALPTWVQHLSFGGLTQPTKDWNDKVMLMERYFLKWHPDDDIKRGKRVVERLVNQILKHMDVPKELVQSFIRLRTIIRMNYLNHKLETSRKCLDSQRRKGAKKMRKIVG